MANDNLDPCDGAQGPQMDVGIFDPYCNLSKRPFLMTGLLRLVLTTHFSESEHIEAPELRNNVWTASESNSGILIESITRWYPQQTEKVPAVVLKRNTYQQVRLGINHQWQNWCDGGKTHYTVAWQGSHTLFNIGGNGAEADLLATEVARELTEFGPLIRKYLNLFRFDVIQIGSVAIIEETKQRFMVPVTAAYAYGEDWTITPSA